MDARLELGESGPGSAGDHEPSRRGRLAIGGQVGAPVLFVVNPASGGGKAAREWAEIESWLPSTGLHFESAMTTKAGDASQIAHRAVRESRPVVVAVGGDGTLNEVVNGFFRNGAPVPTTTKLAMVPLGTGGDFRRTLRIPLDPKAAVQVITSGLVRRLDAGCVTFQTPQGATAVRHFINIGSAGLSAEVADRVNRGSKRFGAAAFTLTAFGTLMTWRNKPFTVVVDGETHSLVAQQVAVANCQYFGGGMRMAPTASPTDGVFDIVLVGNAGKMETIRGMSDIRTGKHLDQHNPRIQLRYGKRVSIMSPQKVRIELDGEHPGFLPALFEIQPGTIEFIAPR